jgi:hypothetical protein
MTSNNTGEDGTPIVFDTTGSFVSSTSLNPTTTTLTNNNNNYELLVSDMLDAELDSDPQMSDSELSWQSVTDVDSLTATNHWRGWKQQTTTSSTTIINTTNSSPPTNSTSICCSFLTTANEGLIKYLKKTILIILCLDRIPTLVDLSAKTIARHIPFELVERYNQPEQPVPENLQLKIAFWSFPDGIEDIRYGISYQFKYHFV